MKPESTDDIIRKMRSGEFREIYGGSLKMWDRVADRLEAAVRCDTKNDGETGGVSHESRNGEREDGAHS